MSGIIYNFLCHPNSTVLLVCILFSCRFLDTGSLVLGVAHGTTGDPTALLHGGEAVPRPRIFLEQSPRDSRYTIELPLGTVPANTLTSTCPSASMHTPTHSEHAKETHTLSHTLPQCYTLLDIHTYPVTYIRAAPHSIVHAHTNVLSCTLTHTQW